MSQRLEVNYNKKPCYSIRIEESFDSLAEELSALGYGNNKFIIVTDSNVCNLYAEKLKDILSKVSSQVLLFTFPAGEEHKTLSTVQDCYEFLIKNQVDRKDVLVALGGGVVGDLTGYTAATYLRGIDFIQVPTTLLAQLDSSIGGKTGVDFSSYKNMVGAFKMPKLVYMNLSTLSSLDDRQFFNGFAEAMKHGLIKDSSYYEWMISMMDEIHNRDYNTLEQLVFRSCEIKKTVVEKDPLEKGDRALLNLGHTIGHAIEKYKNFMMQHGECVALGCVCAAFISWKKELLAMEEYYEIRDMFVPFHLPISIDDIDIDEIIRITKSDKKMEQGTLKFILLKKVGKSFIDTTVTEQEMKEALEEIIYRNEME